MRNKTYQKKHFELAWMGLAICQKSCEVTLECQIENEYHHPIPLEV